MLSLSGLLLKKVKYLLLCLLLCVFSYQQCQCFTISSSLTTRKMDSSSIVSKRTSSSIISSSSCFHQALHTTYSHKCKSIGSRFKVKLYSQSSNSNGESDIQHTKSQNIIVLPFDGAVADTSSWRSNLAIDVAYLTWPIELAKNELKNYELDDPTSDRTWVVNKLNALMQHLLTDQNGMTNCDAVFLTRLLMEEQLLDQGRSVGKKGKYASKFHPKSFSDDSDHRKDSNSVGSNQGSRPLTVGEIAANWVNGACLKDTVRIKYNIDKKDPLPFIKDGIFGLLQNDGLTYELPVVHPEIVKWLHECNDSLVFIMVGHETHLETALKTLEKSSISPEILSLDSIEDVLIETHRMQMESQRDCKCKNSIYLVAPVGDRGHIGILQQIIMSAKHDCETSLHFIHPILKTLEKSALLFGDNRPPLDGFGKSALRANVLLKLSLPTWTDFVGVKEQNDALMCAWLNVIENVELSS